MSKYIGNIPVPSATQTKTRIVATSEQTSFTTSGEYTPGHIDVFLGGVKLDSSEFTATDGTTVVLASGANTGQIFESISYTTFKVDASSLANQSGHSGKYLTTDGTNTSWADVSLTGLGVTATAVELNILDGVTATTAELNYVDGVTSNIQTQLDTLATVPAVGTKTSSYTLTTADTGKYVQVGTGGSITIPDATFSEGDVVNIFNNTTGDITITCSITTAYISGDDTDVASVTLATRGLCSIFFISGTVCVLAGAVS